MLSTLAKISFLILVSILSIKYILFWTYIWQFKEYRWDRFKDFLNSHEGRKAFFNIFYLGKVFAFIAIIMILASFFFILYTEEANTWLIIYTFFIAASILFLFFETSLYLRRLIKKTVKIPVFTKKAMLLILFSVLMTFYLITSSYPPNELIIFSEIGIFVCLSLLSLILIPLFTAISNLLIYPFSYILKEQRIKEASLLMKTFDGTVIGITGSYGKSSVKEYVAGLLSQKFDVIKTPKNVNTEIGVANCIIQELRNWKIKTSEKKENQKLDLPAAGRQAGIGNWKLATFRNFALEDGTSQKNPSNPSRQVIGQFPILDKEWPGEVYDFFVCEMGAYRIGEIKKLCDMVKPRIGILTGINEQHIALFGSIENTIKAKSELLQSLPKGGIAIINNDDENSRSISVPDGIKKISYGFRSDSNIQAEIGNWKLEIGLTSPARNWGLLLDNKIIDISSKLIWKHEIQNILPAIAVAKEAGMDIGEIKKAVENLEPTENGMKIKKIREAIIIDDTYNSNPTGVKAALEILDSINKPNKILVLDDIWELGKESERIHRELAKIISAKKYNKIILTGKNYAEFMKEELILHGMDTKRINTPKSPLEGGTILKEYLQEDSAILFEGRMSKKYLYSFAK
ncbi:MAG: UDP-N-acetylmuramoyl-tripeptide--D-alanyl-D-alanine ligase [bacterium]